MPGGFDSHSLPPKFHKTGLVAGTAKSPKSIKILISVMRTVHLRPRQCRGTWSPSQRRPSSLGIICQRIVARSFAAITVLEQPQFATSYYGYPTAPDVRISLISSSEKFRTSRRISSVCSPSKGERTTLDGESDSLTGLPTDRYFPRVG